MLYYNYIMPDILPGIIFYTLAWLLKAITYTDIKTVYRVISATNIQT